MARQRYMVDWSDQAFPKIVKAENHWFGDTDSVTFGEAKQQIIDRWVHLRDHAQQQINEVRDLRTSDIEEA
jgi:hypothetical protein